MVKKNMGLAKRCNVCGKELKDGDVIRQMETQWVHDKCVDVSNISTGSPIEEKE